MRLTLTLAVTLMLCVANAAMADEKDSIALTVFDYMDGWYNGDAAQMERSLHPDLAKRSIHTDDKGHEHLEHMSAMRLVQLARSGIGRNTPADERVKEVVILDVDDDVASVKAIMHDWIDYLHLARIEGRWVIVNVLWDMNE